MLIYHPAFDAYHCVFRALVIVDRLREVEFPKLRILDYYLCFPAEVSKVSLPREHGKIKKPALELKNEYRGPVSEYRAFRDLEPIQTAAVRLLAASRIVDAKKLELGVVSRTDIQLPSDFQELVDAPVFDNESVVSYILDEMSKIELSGHGGLKQRTGLMEYRYDAV